MKRNWKEINCKYSICGKVTTPVTSVMGVVRKVQKKSKRLVCKMVIWGYRLYEELLKISVSDKIAEAIKEWEWTETYLIEPDEDPETCLCGHYPIRECCVITNKITGEEVIVGNCCINRIVKTESDLIFQALKRVKKDVTKSFNFAVIEYAYRKHIINEWEYEFYESIMRKRELSPKQYSKKLNINIKILNSLRKNIESKKGITLDEKYTSVSKKQLFNF